MRLDLVFLVSRACHPEMSDEFEQAILVSFDQVRRHVHWKDDATNFRDATTPLRRPFLPYAIHQCVDRLRRTTSGPVPSSI